MPADSFQNMCIFHTLDGLREGLSHFSQPSRCALIYAIGPQDTIRVYDPQNMLRGHGPILKELYLDSDEWRKAPSNFENGQTGFDYSGRCGPRCSMRLEACFMAYDDADDDAGVA